MIDLNSNEASARLAAEPKPADHEPWSDAALTGSVAERFETISVRHGARDAIRTDHTSCTYDELRAGVNGLGHAVAAVSGPTPSPVLALVAGDIAPSLAAFGIASSGMIHVPVEPSDPLERLRVIARDSGAAAVVCDESTVDIARGLGVASVISVEEVDRDIPAPPSVHIDADQVCRILYTSGSTGAPRGVTRSHREVLAGVAGPSNRYGITPRDRVGMIGPSTFSGAISDMLLALLNGACLLPFDVKRRGLTRMRAWLERDMPTTFYMVPSLWRSFARSLPSDVTFASVRHLRFGAEALLRSDIESARRHLPPEAYILNNLGSTEVGVYARYVADHHTVIETDHVPSGYPAAGRSIEVVDDQGAPVPRGARGDIVIRLSSQSSYWNDEAGTAATFVTNPTGDVAYRTGDRGYIDGEGVLHFVGRREGLLKVLGNRVEAGEVEAALMAVDGVSDVAVTGHDRKGSDSITAYVVLERGSGLDAASVRTAVSGKLPNHAVPSTVMPLDELPRTPRGKVDWSSFPEPGTEDEAGDDALSDVEEALIEIWSKELDGAVIGRHDDFFDLGATSLDALSMFAAVERRLGHDLAPTTLMRAPTVAQLAEVIESGGGQRGDHSLVPLREAGERIPLFCVHGGGGGVFFVGRMLDHVHPDRPLYGLQAAGFEGKPPPYRTVEEMAARYVAEVRVVQPSGPYALTGLSLGGAIAWEMAQQLRASGERVALLGLIDTKPFETFTRETQANIGDRALGMERVFSQALIPRIWRRLQRMLRACVLKVWLMTGRRLPDRFRLRNSYFWPLHARAVRAYIPAVYDSDVTVVSEQGTVETHREIWSPRVRGELTIVEVPAHHLQLEHEPFVGEVVRAFEERLEEFEAKLRATP